MDLVFLSDVIGDIGIVLVIVYFIWLFGWGKKALGSAKLAILMALTIVFLIFIQHMELVWVPVILFLLATFGKEFLNKVIVQKG